MKPEKLPKTTIKKKKRVGRGYGSGKGGHTVGRGQKGQKARGKVGLMFEGTKVKKSLLKRLPLRRGKGKLKPKPGPVVVNLKYLNILPKNTVVDLDSLAKHGIVTKDEGERYGVKILGEGDLSIPLTIKLPISGGAKKKVEKAGGKVECQELPETKAKRIKKQTKKGKTTKKAKTK